MHYAARCRSPLPHLIWAAELQYVLRHSRGRVGMNLITPPSIECHVMRLVVPLRALGGIWLIGHPSVIRTFRTFWGIRLRRFNQFRGVHLACLQCVPKSQLISDRGACEKITKPIQEVSNLDFGLSLGSLLPRVKKGWFFWAINPSRKKSIFWSPNVQWSKLLISLQLSMRDVTAVVCG